MTKIVEILGKRRSTKKFKEYKISKEEINSLIESARLVPSSFGIEPFEILFIINKEFREGLKSICWNQQSIVESSAFILWKVYNTHALNNGVLDERINATVPDGFEKIKEYKKLGVKKVWENSGVEGLAWSSKQAYISLSATLLNAEELNLNTCPIEGFNAFEMNEFLSSKGLLDLEKQHVAVGLLVGKTDINQDHHYAFDKVRKSKDVMSKIID